MWVGNGGATDGTEVVPPMYGGNPLHVAWAGERLLYDVNTGGQPTIVGLTPGRGTAEVVVPQGGGPAATSDGRTVVFNSFETGARAGLWKADADGRHAVQLVPGDVGSAVVVTGDDRYVIFMSGRSGVQSPWIVPIDGGSPVLLINRPARPGGGVSADGRSFVFVALDKNPRQLVVCDLPACHAPRSYAAPPRPSPISSSPVRWMPDDRGVAYTDATQSNLWVQPFDGESPYQLTHFTDRIIEDFAWSHDGKRLAIARSTTTNDVVLFKGLR
jgi:Tol biopolymer transport system component